MDIVHAQYNKDEISIGPKLGLYINLTLVLNFSKNLCRNNKFYDIIYQVREYIDYYGVHTMKYGVNTMK